ncbi:MAG: 2,3-bisphosphoglycerate-independent phosphoglycerate mutase [Coriobacteriales bacterium]|jgi:2,3-bisphosphoglycerate-independent phosphoglycerate mutase|nr:2,3-bisphosphoglycerate-independent phosphoglycerate mutase [Coriobacteriales bacterium]
MKYAIVILDGASGNPLAAYGGRTTLQAAHTPYLDALARAGAVGLARNVPEGLEPSSNVACTSIVGYNPVEYPIGRGALELAALGIELQDDEVAMRVNLAHVSPAGIMVSYSTDNISSEDGHALADELTALDDATFKLYKGTGFRQYLVVKGHPELLVSSFAAAHNITDLPVADFPPSGPAAALIMDWQRRAGAILAASAVNKRRVAAGKLAATQAFAFWPGQRPGSMEPFARLYGKQAGMLSGVDLLAGIAQLAGIKRYGFAGVTDGPDNNYAAQGEGALTMLGENDVVIIHVEAPDAEGHDGNIEGKRLAVEAIDREVLSRLMAYAAQTPLRILALPDHPTPVELKRHTDDLVPFVLSGPGIQPNAGTRLTEQEAASTGLVVDPGYLLMGRLLA